MSFRDWFCSFSNTHLLLVAPELAVTSNEPEAPGCSATLMAPSLSAVAVTVCSAAVSPSPRKVSSTLAPGAKPEPRTSTVSPSL